MFFLIEIKVCSVLLEVLHVLYLSVCVSLDVLLSLLAVFYKEETEKVFTALLLRTS